MDTHRPGRPKGGKTGRPFKEFCVRGHTLSETRRHHRGGTYCWKCCTAHSREWRAKNRQKAKEISREQVLQKYRLSLEDFDRLLTEQDGKCAICGTSDWGTRNPFIDHDHISGRVRGLLCHRCNTGIGMLGDDIEVVRRALRYLGG